MTHLRHTISALLGCAALIAAAGCSRTPPPGSYRIFVTNESSGDLSVIDSTTKDVTSTVHIGKRPRGIHASPDGKTIYVALSGSPIAGPGVDESTLPPPDKSQDGIGVFDVEQNKVVRVIKSGSDPEEFDVSKDGKFLYVSNEDAAGVSILDIAAGQVVKTLRTGEEPEGVRLSPDGKLVFVTSEAEGTVSAVDTQAQTLAKTFKVGRRPRSIAFMPNGQRAYISAENDGNVVAVDVAKFEVTDTIELGKPGVIKPMKVILSADGATLFVSTGRGHQVFFVNTADNKIVGSLEVGPRPWGLALSPDGKTLFTANGSSNDISVVDVAGRSVTKKIKLIGSPWGIVTLPR